MGNTRNRIRHIDLFSGKGTFIERAKLVFPNYECVAACEIDPYAQNLLHRHVESGIITSDIRDFDAQKFTNIDLLTGGFPCQDISIAKGKNALGLNGTKSGLWYEMLRISSVLRPRVIIIENTPALLRRGLDTILANLAAERYDAVWTMLSAAQFGYPHRRKRIFIAAFDTDRIRREEIYIYARTVEKKRQEEDSYWKNIQLFGGLNRPGFWREDYARFLGMDYGYSGRTNAHRLRVIGNSIIPECIDTILQSISHVF